MRPVLDSKRNAVSARDIDDIWVSECLLTGVSQGPGEPGTTRSLLLSPLTKLHAPVYAVLHGTSAGLLDQ